MRSSSHSQPTTVERRPVNDRLTTLKGCFSSLHKSSLASGRVSRYGTLIEYRATLIPPPPQRAKVSRRNINLARVKRRRGREIGASRNLNNVFGSTVKGGEPVPLVMKAWHSPLSSLMASLGTLRRCQGVLERVWWVEIKDLVKETIGPLLTSGCYCCCLLWKEMIGLLHHSDFVKTHF